VKIRRVSRNNQKREFEVTAYSGRKLSFPYAKAYPAPGSENRLHDVFVDAELGNEAFTYVLESGDEGSIHIDSVLEYNEDPGYLGDLLLHRLTLEAKERVEQSGLSKREIMRRLGTSAAQFYRLLDPTNTRKSIRQLVALLHVLGCEVEVTVKERGAGKS
jgi:hypothetical protein